MSSLGIIKDGEVYDFSVHKMPCFHEVKNKDWLMWGWSKDYYNPDDKKWNNLQPDYYEWLYNSSSKHRAIVNRKTLFINGKGVTYEKEPGQSTQEAVALSQYTFKINNSEIVKKWALNLTKLGGFCYEVIAQKNGKKIDVHYINLKNIRRSKPTYDSDGREEPVLYYYTRNWASRKPEEEPDFTVFHEWDWETLDSNKRYLVLYSEDEENLYPIPEYTAAVPYIAADYEIGNFTYNNTKNGFVGSYLINFYNGELSPEEKGVIYEQIKAKLHGTDNSGEPVLSFNEEGSQGVDVTPISANGQDDRFINLNKQVREEIFAGHTINPIVVGLEGSNGFNNNADEERVATEHFKKYYVHGKQMTIEQHLNAIRTFNDIKGEVKIQNLDPVDEMVSEAELAQILTMDERRERAGFEPLTEDQKETVIRETITQSEVQFKTEEDGLILNFFASNGFWDEREGFEVIRNKEFFAESVEDAEQQEFTTALEALILRLLGASPNMPVETIAKAAKANVSEVREAIVNLQNDGLIDEEGNVTSEGENEPDEIFIVYKYELRNDATGGDIIPGTRDFCRTLVNLSKFKSWSLEDIKRMNNGQGLDVFRSRGGWYRIPGTDRSRPFCRHIWKQLLVRKANG